MVTIRLVLTPAFPLGVHSLKSRPGFQCKTWECTISPCGLSRRSMDRQKKTCAFSELSSDDWTGLDRYASSSSLSPSSSSSPPSAAVRNSRCPRVSELILNVLVHSVGRLLFLFPPLPSFMEWELALRLPHFSSFYSRFLNFPLSRAACRSFFRPF